jgi:DNA-directed RNA polymerase subunit RPC12/RpoP
MGKSVMGIINNVREQLFGSDEEMQHRYNCRACSSQFSKPASERNAVCPECGEEDRIYRL